MTTLTLTSAPITKGLGCLNGLACLNCGSPLVDTLTEFNTDRKLNAYHCPMCEVTGLYNKFTKTIKTINSK